MKSVTSGMTIQEKVHLIAEIASYALDASLYDESGDRKNEISEAYAEYDLGAIDAVGHMAACCISQWITKDSEPTSDIIEALKLDKYPSRDKIRKRLVKYLKGKL
jgi:hypothetical protein